MPGIRYEGRRPDSDIALATKGFADDAIAAAAVTADYVTVEIARVVSANDLRTATYVDAQDALLAKLADVEAAAAGLLDATARGTTVAPLNGSAQVDVSYIPPGTLLTERTLSTVTGSATFSGTLTATTTNPRERKLATASIADPGFPYHPLPFGTVSGQASGTPVVYPWSGNGVCGLLTVCPPAGSGDTIYGIGGCTDTPTAARYPIVPYAASGATPVNRPPVNGAITLDLYGACFQGSGYTFNSSGLEFWILVVPAL